MQHQFVASLITDLQRVAHANSGIHQGRAASQSFDGLPMAPVLQVHAAGALAHTLDGVAFCQINPRVVPRVYAHRAVDAFAVVQRAHQAAPAQYVQGVGMGDEGAHIVVCRVEHDFFRFAVLNDLAVFHDRDAAPQFQGFVQIVADKHNGLAELALQLQQFVLQALANQRVQCREGFIHQQNIGVHGQCPGQADPLLHAAAQFIRLFVAPLGQAHQLQLFVHQGASFLLGPALHLQTKTDVLAHG